MDDKLVPTALFETVNNNVVLSIRDKLQDPEGWCCSGCKANEYTLIPTAGMLVWCW